MNENLVDVMASFFSALSDRTRLMIVLYLMEKGSASVQDLSEGLGKSQSLISHHLACLKNCGVVRVEKKGKYSYYYIADEEVKKIITMAINHAIQYGKSIMSCEIIKLESLESATSKD
ncbi:MULTISPECIES: ArsR/SmtB family transcription factor [unclassified Stygiolobus]|uniref:ArsR/SmtB family transcription factor n=1 Tax=unclassified Stygiolobus TaxID=2824672 RepID=UPI00307DE840